MVDFSTGKLIKQEHATDDTACLAQKNVHPHTHYGQTGPAKIWLF